MLRARGSQHGEQRVAEAAPAVPLLREAVGVGEKRAYNGADRLADQCASRAAKASTVRAREAPKVSAFSAVGVPLGGTGLPRGRPH